MTTTANNVDGSTLAAPTPTDAEFSGYDSDSVNYGTGVIEYGSRPSSGGSAAVDWFQMLGVSPTGAAIYWKVSGSADFAGTSAPGVVTNVTLVRTWTV